MVIPEPKEFSFDKAGVQGKIFPIEQLTSQLQILMIETEEGHQTEIIEHGSNFLYYVLRGAGEFIINSVIHSCKRGDLVVVPRGHKFTYKGKLKMLLICYPPWSEQQEEIV